MLEIGVLALGAAEVDRAVDFWCASLGYERRTDGFGGRPVVLAPPGNGAGTRIALQPSAAAPQDHPRWHLDLHVDSAKEQAHEADGLAALGARRIAWDSCPDDPDLVVLEDPEGNRSGIVDVNRRER